MIVVLFRELLIKSCKFGSDVLSDDAFQVIMFVSCSVLEFILVFKFNLLRKWLLIAFCLENPLSHCLALFPVSLAISDHRLNSRLQRKLQEQS